MSLRRAALWLVTGAALAALTPALRAQQPAAAVTSQSFWVGHAPGAAISGHTSVRKTSGKMSGPLKKSAGGTERVAPRPKDNDTISQAIEANRSVPWSIVLGLTLLTLLPALLLSITPMVRLLVVFHFLRQ